MVELQQNKDARVSKGYVIDDDANLYRWPPKRTLPVVGDIDSLNGNLIGNSDHGAGKQSKGLPPIFNLPDPLSSLALESSKNLLRLKLRHVDTTQLKDGIPFGFLLDVVTPYINALIQVQGIIDTIYGRPIQDIMLFAIKYSSVT
jgi:hypothetical protein